jgi:Lipid A 3-O-deacylase (PagL)
VSRDDGCAFAASGSRRGTRRGAGALDALRRRPRLAAAARFRPAGAARFAVCFAVRFTLRLADRFAVFFFDAVLLDALRDFVAVFAVFRRFLAMRAPPDDWARILSDKLVARVVILRVFFSFLLVALASPVFAEQPGGRAAPDSGSRMPFERGTIEISAIGGVSLPISLFRANSDHQLAMASLAIGRVMAGGPGKGSFELLLDVTPFFQVRQPELVRGWSVAPLFMRWNFPGIGDSAVRIFGEVSGSLLFTTAPVPVRTTTFNFLDQAGFGMRFEESRGRAWLVGYRFQHISNAGRVKPNPGANFNLVYLGVSFLR